MIDIKEYIKDNKNISDNEVYNITITFNNGIVETIKDVIDYGDFNNNMMYFTTRHSKKYDHFYNIRNIRKIEFELAYVVEADENKLID